MDVQSNNPQPVTKFSKKQLNIQKSQEQIYRFLLNIVTEWAPDKVLLQFKYLFINYERNNLNVEVLKEISDLLFNNNEIEFYQTIKRSCYILINNWETSRQYIYIKELIALFSELNFRRTSLSPNLSRLKKWLEVFVNSKDFQDIKIFAARYEDNAQIHWSERYTSYLLVPQYIDLNNSREQREAARAVSQKIKERFKIDLAMYIARSQSPSCTNNMPKNPTSLGHEVLLIIKRIMAIRGRFSYPSLANIFIAETKGFYYKEFKEALKNYLFFSIGDKKAVRLLKAKLSEKLDILYEDYHEKLLDDALLLRTCNRVIEYVTTENKQEPSSLFILLISEGSPINLVSVLLKIILICRNARTHLESCIAALIEYYMQYPESECQWMIKFMEIFNVTFAIYAENVEYNLIKMHQDTPDELSDETLETYRIFSQLKFGEINS